MYTEMVFLLGTGSTNSYTDMALTNNTDYEYSVTAVYSDGRSDCRLVW